jgi:hypothetical protein
MLSAGDKWQPLLSKAGLKQVKLTDRETPTPLS